MSLSEPITVQCLPYSVTMHGKTLPNSRSRRGSNTAALHLLRAVKEKHNGMRDKQRYRFPRTQLTAQRVQTIEDGAKGKNRGGRSGDGKRVRVFVPVGF